MILDRIIESTKKIVWERASKIPVYFLKDLIADMPPTVSFKGALHKPGKIALIAEVKKASPSKGVIREDFRPVEIAQSYTEAGASAISVLTEEKFFQGHPDYLAGIREVTPLPLLRKDFIISPYQIYEARFLGADAILLIAAILRREEIMEYLEIARSLGLDCLVEVHNEKELKEVLTTGATIIGINNRNLKTFHTDLETTFRLRELIKDTEIIVVSESGIRTYEEVERLKSHGINAILVGETLMRSQEIKQEISFLLGG